MQKIKPLLDQASKGLKNSSSVSPTAAGQNRAPATQAGVEDPRAEFDAQPGLDHVDAINQVFAEFEFAYHNQFHKAFASADSLSIAKKYWLSSLEHFPPRQIVMAAKRVIRTSEYLPSISVILQACEKGYDLFGLPAARQAYFEACAAPSPKKDQQWSHEAVYYAGKAAGWYTLANEPEGKAFPLFDYHYQQLCQRVMSGEELNIATTPALTDKIEKPLPAEEAKARMAKLKKDLGL
ncbi:MAG: replication protein P [Gammaproteobacteria bacterium]